MKTDPTLSARAVKEAKRRKERSEAIALKERYATDQKLREETENEINSQIDSALDRDQ